MRILKYYDVCRLLKEKTDQTLNENKGSGTTERLNSWTDENSNKYFQELLTA